jgi:hypothetical protein
MTADVDATFTGFWRGDGTFSGLAPEPGADETVNVP